MLHFRGRIVCPNDPKHTVKKADLQKHLSRCNSRQRDDPWMVENLNVAESLNEEEAWYRPTVDELTKMLTVIVRIYDDIADSITDSFLRNNDIEICIANSPKLNKKHILQISSISEHLAIAGLLNSDERWCLIDFGAGRAQLFYWMAKIAPKCRFLLVERTGSRNKFDNKVQKEIGLVSIERLRCSVEHLDLSRNELIKSVDNIVAVWKHFCGAASDFGIRCLINGQRNGLNICGFALAPCCHHRTIFREYIGRPFLQTYGICNSNEFAALRHISTWAVCGFPEQVDDGEALSHLTELNNANDQKALSKICSLKPAEKELFGRKAKAILEFGRAVELRKFGYNVALYRYIERDVSPENLLIVGKKIEI